MPVTRRNDAVNFFDVVGDRLKNAVSNLLEDRFGGTLSHINTLSTDQDNPLSRGSDRLGTVVEPQRIKFSAEGQPPEQMEASASAILLAETGQVKANSVHSKTNEGQEVLPVVQDELERSIFLQTQALKESPNVSETVTQGIEGATNTVTDISPTEEGSKIISQFQILKQQLQEKNHEILCLKDCLWKISHPVPEDKQDTDAMSVVSYIVSDLVDKAAFFGEHQKPSELLEGIVDMKAAVQNLQSVVDRKPVEVSSPQQPVKRKRGRPPKTNKTPKVQSSSVPKAKKPRIEAALNETVIKVEPKGPWEEDTGPVGSIDDCEEGEPIRTTRLRRRSRTRKLSEESGEDTQKEVVRSTLFDNQTLYNIPLVEDMDEGNDSDGMGALSDLSDQEFDPAAEEEDLEEKPRRRRRRKPGRPRKSAGYVSKVKKPHARKIRHVCKICDRSFYHGRPFKRHLLSYGKGRCSCRKCREVYFNHATFLHHECSHEKPRFQRRICRLCSENFASAKSLTQHQREVHGIKTAASMHNCKFCDKEFELRKVMYDHYCEEHAEGQLVCRRCGDFFIDQPALDAHTVNEHPNDKEWSCEACGGNFHRKSQYEAHLEGQNKNQCIICNQLFCTKKMLEKHNKNIHGIKLPDDPEQEAKFSCDDCGKTFQRQRQLDIHMRIHTGRVYLCIGTS